MMIAGSPNAFVAPEYLEQSAVYIKDNLNAAIESVYLAGLRLLEVRDALKGDGRYMRWLSESVGISHDSASNYINVALRGREAIGLNIPLRAVYQLVAPNADADGRQAAIVAAQDGDEIDHKSAFIYAQAPAYIREAYERGELTKDAAHATVKALKFAHPEVRVLCYLHRVHHAAMVDYLQAKRLEKDKTAHWAKPSTSYDDVAANGFLQMQEGAISIMYADAETIKKYTAERAAYYRQEALQIKYTWQQKRLPVRIVDNAPVLDLSGVEGVFTEGAELVVNIRFEIGE